ncbi:Lrp/AsnC family transcriptional regulator [Nocardiopsis trehalosi]|uniref:Lrp/AsnC family transcriptional regulator n=1 Tax=Nocardiopsis trehalosi TaxID=109329 RepID=UPI000A4D87B7|nr:Lrp/AsnC family transcriptional regulator [Nocardiopsis trehalosi]
MRAPSLDDLDLDLVAALQRAPRAPINVLAEVLGSSPSTIGRRLQRLQAENLLRVIGQVDWSLFSDAHPRHVWLTTDPGRSEPVARRLAERPETQLVALTTGGADVYCVVHPAGRGQVRDLLTHAIPSVEGVRSTQSDLVLRPVTRADSWCLDRLSADRTAALAAYGDPVAADAADGPGEPPTGAERQAVRLLYRDARTGSAELARVLGVSQSTAYRITQSLLERGVIRPRVEVEPALLGMGLEVVVSLAARPGAVARVAGELGRHPSARYVSVVAGSGSVIHHGVFRDEAALERFLSVDLAGLPGVTGVRVSVVLDVLRRYWIMRSGVRLGAAAAPFPAAPAD